MHQNLQMLPYKIQILKAQTAADKVERLAFSQSISLRSEDHPNFLDLIFFSDEAHFHLSGQVNKQNMQFWAQAQPYEHALRPLSVEKVTWFAIGRNGIIRPYWFKDDNGQH